MIYTVHEVLSRFGNLAQWSALVGFLLPMLIAVVQQPFFTRPVRTGIGIAASLLAALFTAWAAGRLTWNGWADSLIFVFLTAMTAYRNVWVPIGAAPWVEFKTSRKATARTGTTHTREATHGQRGR